MEKRGEQVYQLKLDMLLTVLNANRQTCYISAKVSLGALAVALGNGKLGRGKDKLTGAIELILQNGQVASVNIRDQNGQTIAAGEQALAASRRCGELSWVVRPTFPQNQDNTPPVKKLATDPRVEVVDNKWPTPRAWTQRFPPRWTHLLTQDEVDVLPRKHRQVLLLIDGKRGVDELCRMLNCTYEQLTIIFNDLIVRNLIFFPRDNE